jgi:hypothetical protein
LSSEREDMGTKVSVTGLTDVAAQKSKLCPRNYAAAATITVTSNISLHIMMKNVMFLENLWEGEDSIF